MKLPGVMRRGRTVYVLKYYNNGPREKPYGYVTDEFSYLVDFVCHNHRPNLNCWACPLHGSKLESYNKNGCIFDSQTVEHNVMYNEDFDIRAYASEVMTEALNRIDSYEYYNLQYTYVKPPLIERIRDIFKSHND